ncbi:MAG: nucleoside deaminase [Puniceicoccales bacterium]|jgi:tRNA(adenine34) deaminase|nr:nucleoside deaminase [Puniceicoccales bacterium]
MGMRLNCPFGRKYPSPQPKDDAFFMAMAYNEGIRAWEEDEVPVGAVVVYDRRIIAAAHNRIEARQEATAHAEMLVLSQAARALGGWRLNGCMLYSTKEPCPMCAAAARLSRVDAIIFGIPEHRPLDPNAALPQGLALRNLPNPPHPSVRCGILAEDCYALLRGFFSQRRGKIPPIALGH